MICTSCDSREFVKHDRDPSLVVRCSYELRSANQVGSVEESMRRESGTDTFRASGVPLRLLTRPPIRVGHETASESSARTLACQSRRQLLTISDHICSLNHTGDQICLEGASPTARQFHVLRVFSAVFKGNP